MSVDFTKEELQAVAECIQSAWKDGIVKNPVFAHHLINASGKLGDEFRRIAPDESKATDATPQDNGDGDRAKQQIPVDTTI